MYLQYNTSIIVYGENFFSFSDDLTNIHYRYIYRYTVYGAFLCDLQRNFTIFKILLIPITGVHIHILEGILI